MPSKAPARRLVRLRVWGRRLGYFTAASAVAGVSADYYTGYSISRSLRALASAAYIAYLYKTTTPESMEELAALHRTAAGTILYVCMRNEGLYIKIGQSLTAMNHILPKEYIDTMKVLLDAAPTVPYSQIRQVVEEETGRPLEESFEYFDPEPIASASIAQVHRAWLPPPAAVATGPIARREVERGTHPEDVPLREGSIPVAVKVQKPNISYQIYWDMQTYRLINWMISALFDFPIGWARRTIVDGTRREADFRIEADNACRMHSDFQSNPLVYVPEVFTSFTSKRLLVLEWVDALRMVDVPRVASAFNASDVLTDIFDVFGDMIFKNGFVHCDPHAANILVRPNQNPRNSKRPYEIVLIDFGLCIPETERFRVMYALLFKAIFTQDLEMLKAIVSSWGIRNAEIFASLQVQKPYDSLRRGQTGEVTREELAAMQKQTHVNVKSLMEREDLIPKELPFIGRSIDLLRALNRMYGSPINRTNMFVRRAVASLGPIYDVAGAERYLNIVEKLKRRRAASSPDSTTVDDATRGVLASLGVLRMAHDAVRKFFFGSLDSHKAVGQRTSLFDASACEDRVNERAAVILAEEEVWSASVGQHLTRSTQVMYRALLFELTLFLFSVTHWFTKYYNLLVTLILPDSAQDGAKVANLEDILEQRAKHALQPSNLS